MGQAIEGRASEAAERYAHAAFELAQEGGALDALEKDFKAFDAAIQESADLRVALASPLIGPEDKSRAIVAVAQKIGVSPLGCNVLGLVARNGRAFELAGVSRAFRARLARHRGVSQVEVISARPLNPAQLAEIVGGVEKSLGSKIDAVTRVDESLIGGFIVRAGSRQFDASLSSKLQSLKLALKSA